MCESRLSNLSQTHPNMAVLERDLQDGSINRREFLTRATALGIAATAFGPLATSAQPTSSGGKLRIQMRIMSLRDPRSFDFTEMYNACAGLLDLLVRAERDGRLVGMLLESWEANEDASQYTLHIRDGVHWNNGEALSAAHVAANFKAWCDSSIAGNSMATRLSALSDPETGQIRTDSVEIVDALTLKLYLTHSDITLIPSLSDYPACVMHPSQIGASPLDAQIGTGAYRIAEYQPGTRAVLQRNLQAQPWRQAYLDEIEFIDLGPSPAVAATAAEDGRIDMVYDSSGDFVGVMDALGWQRSEIDTAATIVLRANQTSDLGGFLPYADVRVRRALSLAVSNEVLLELGYGGLGTVGENHHVAPIHPDYADIGSVRQDVGEARRLMQEAGMLEFEHELVSIDDDWRRFTTDVMAAQLRDAGFNVKRVILPAEEYHAGWREFAFSSTNWNGRELGVQVLDLAYRSGSAWNETGFANHEFDQLLDEAKSIVSAEARRIVMAKLETILIDEAVIVQPYWRRLIRHCRPGVQGGERHQKDMIDPYALSLSN